MKDSMSSFLHEKGKPASKNKLFFLPIPEDPVPRVIVVVIYALLIFLIFSYLWPIAIGALATYLIIKFIPAQKVKIVCICIVVLVSVSAEYLWLQKVSKDKEFRKERQAIATAQKAEQKQKDRAEKAKQDAANQAAKVAADAAKVAADAKAKEQFVNGLISICVDNHKSIYKPKIDELMNGSIVSESRYPISYSKDDCNKIISGLYNKYSQDEVQKIAKARFWIGMDYKELFFSLGLPKDSNSTTTIFGSSVQLIYGDPLYGATYIYLDNGKVTSYQNW